MSTEEGKDTEVHVSRLAGEKILAGVLYIVTGLFVLGFLWQSIASFLFHQ